MLCEASEYLLAHKDDGQPKTSSSGNGTDESSMLKKEEANKGPLVIDATCAPATIRYPQDISLLSEARAKLDVSIDEEGYGRLEKVSFDAYNESGCLIEAVERYRSRTGHYPECVLADQIYRTRDNRAYCKKYGIWLSGPKLDRPSQDAKTDKKQECQDNTDRIEVERFFSRNKRCYGQGCVVTKLKKHS